jgi:hypothetical protein
MKKIFIIVFAFLLLFLAASVKANNVSLIANENQKKYFIENKGQWPEDVLYFTRFNSMDVWITKTGVNYNFHKIESNNIFSPKSEHKVEDYTILNHRIIVNYLGCNLNPLKESNRKQQGCYNYLIGNNTIQHATNVGLFEEVLVKNVYEGIDIRYYFDQSTLRYDYIVHPGANPNNIQFKLSGQYFDETKDNQILLTTRFGQVAFKDLYTYQENNSVYSSFQRNGEVWQVKVGNYDVRKTLIIDPLVYSTYLGGSSDDRGNKVTVDASGNAYVVGVTASANYDTTAGAFQTTFSGGGFDVFVTKLNNSGANIVYSTLIGGSGNDWGSGIVVDVSGNVYITGYTSSTDFPVSTGAYQTTNDNTPFNGYDAFVTKLNANGTGLIYSTYLGGNNDDVGFNIAVDASGNAFVTGYTSSTNFDITSGAYQTTRGAFNDAYITKLNATGTSLVYSTFLGGDNSDTGYGIAVDASGNAYVTGETVSTDFPTTSGVYQTAGAGGNEAFITKMNSSGSALVYSTYIGGNATDYGASIAIDGSGNAYITGRTASSNFPTTSGAFQSIYGGGNEDSFVTKLNASGTSLVYSTYLSGNSDEIGFGLTLDGNGNAYVTGYTSSTDFPVSSGAFQTSNNGSVDVFVTKLNSAGTNIEYSTFIGGSDFETGNGIALDASGNIYVTGETNSTNFNVTTSAFQSPYGGGWRDVFVSKISLNSTQVFNSNALEINMKLYPNPATDNINLQLNQNGVLEVYSIDGKLIESVNINTNIYKLNIQHYNKGMYMLRFIGLDGNSYQSKFIKE